MNDGQNINLHPNDGDDPQRESAEQTDQLVGEWLAKRYLLERRLERGGFGAVYSGIDSRYDSKVAIKVLTPPFSDNEFRREAKLNRAFRHPNVVEVYDYGIDRGLAFIVMEYLQGDRVDQLLHNRYDRVFPFEMLDKFVHEITSALHNAHEQSLIHRDLKPQNVMLIDEGKPTERFILHDFGIAAQTDGSNTLPNSTRDTAFTPNYGAPERFAGEETDQRTDIYSFGIILYELVTGCLPFQGDRLFVLMQAVQNDPPPPFAEVAPHVQGCVQIETLVMRCLEKDPRDRPQTMAELREEYFVAREAQIPNQADRVRFSEQWKQNDTPSATTELTFGVDDNEPTIDAPETGDVTATDSDRNSETKGMATVEFGPDGFPSDSAASNHTSGTWNWTTVKSLDSTPSGDKNVDANQSSVREAIQSIEFGPDGFPSNGDPPEDPPPGFDPKDDGNSYPPATSRGDFDRNKIRDEVDCTVFAPRTVIARHPMLIQVFAHHPGTDQQVIDAAKEFDLNSSRLGVTSLGTEISRGSKLKFTLSSPKLLAEQQSKELVWRGRFSSVQFSVEIPNNVPTGDLHNTIHVLQNEIPIGDITFKISVVADLNENGLQPIGVARRYSDVFVSYARRDLFQVSLHVAMLREVGVRYFQDVFGISQGEEWLPAIHDAIDKSDALFLFWSSAAKSSAWVEREWKYALQVKDPGFIRPFVIEGPPVPDPPSELSHLQFGHPMQHFVSVPFWTRCLLRVKLLLRRWTTGIVESQ